MLWKKTDEVKIENKKTNATILPHYFALACSWAVGSITKPHKLPSYNVVMVCTVLPKSTVLSKCKSFSPDFTELATFSCPITQTSTLLIQTWTQISTINIQALKYARTSLYQPHEFMCKPHSKVMHSYNTSPQAMYVLTCSLCFAFKDF